MLSSFDAAKISKRFNSSKKIEVFFLYLFATVLYCSVYRFIWWLLKKARFLWEAGRKAIRLIGIESFHPVLFQNPDDVILFIKYPSSEFVER